MTDECIPWDFEARLSRSGHVETEVGTLRGCVRAWSALSEIDQSACAIHCIAKVWISGWHEARTVISSAAIRQLAGQLETRWHQRGH